MLVLGGFDMGGVSSRVGCGRQSEAEMLRDVGLIKILREDFERHLRDWTRPGLWALWIHRLGVFGTELKWPLRFVSAFFHKLGHVFCRNVFGIEIERTAQIGRRLWVAHQHGIVLHKYARIGDDCVIRQGVTFGVGTEWIENVGPVIGDNVSFWSRSRSHW